MVSADMRKTFKSYALSTAYSFGLFATLRALQRNRITILMYHRFSAKQEPFKLPFDVFEKQLKFLSRRYNFIHFDDYLSAMNGEGPSLPPNPVLITIDDGYQDTFSYAYPVIKKFNLPATVFLATDFIEKSAWLWSNRLEYILKNSKRAVFTFPLGEERGHFNVDTFVGWHGAQLKIFEYCRFLGNVEKDQFLEQLALYLGVRVPPVTTDAFRPLSWEQIKTMSCGRLAFGSHSCSHPICSRLSEDELIAEIVDSKRLIEQKLSAPTEVFCYPNGQHDDFTQSTITHLKRFGYRAAVTTVAGSNTLNDTDPFRLKRLTIGCADPIVLSRTLTRSS